MPTVTAKFSGTCRVCRAPIHVGETIAYFASEPRIGPRHLRCRPEPIPLGLFRQTVAGADPHWTVGQELDNTPERIGRGEPGRLVIAQHGQHYYPRDGRTVGLPGDSGTVYWANCRRSRDATAEDAKGAEVDDDSETR